MRGERLSSGVQLELPWPFAEFVVEVRPDPVVDTDLEASLEARTLEEREGTAVEALEARPFELREGAVEAKTLEAREGGAVEACDAALLKLRECPSLPASLEQRLRDLDSAGLCRAADSGRRSRPKATCSSGENLLPLALQPAPCLTPPGIGGRSGNSATCIGTRFLLSGCGRGCGCSWCDCSGWGCCPTPLLEEDRRSEAIALGGWRQGASCRALS